MARAQIEIGKRAYDEVIRIFGKSVDAKIKSTNAINVIFDFSKVDFMDSSGIGVIMGRFKMTKILGGKVVVYGVKKQVQRIIEMSGIDRLITICSSYDEAIRAV